MADSVLSNLDDFIEDGLDRYIRKAITDACVIVRNDAADRAPHKTGNLERSIKLDVAEDGSYGVVYSDAKYAPYVEVGNGIYATKGQGRDTPWHYPYYSEGKTCWATTEGNKPQPFLEPALNNNKSKINKCFERLF